MKKKYTPIEIEVIGFHTKDIITLSYGETGSSFEGLNFSDLT